MSRARQRRRYRTCARYARHCRAIGGVPEFSPYGRFWRTWARTGGLILVERGPQEAVEATPGGHVSVCPYDTNGDGDCGRPSCPFCGDTGRALCGSCDLGLPMSCTCP